MIDRKLRTFEVCQPMTQANRNDLRNGYPMYDGTQDFSKNPSLRDMLIDRYSRVIQGRTSDFGQTSVATATIRLKELLEDEL